MFPSAVSIMDLGEEIGTPHTCAYKSSQEAEGIFVSALSLNHPQKKGFHLRVQLTRSFANLSHWLRWDNCTARLHPTLSSSFLIVLLHR